jgi:hypothetical protein
VHNHNMRALNLLREALPYRRQAFDGGFRALGYTLVKRLDDPRPGDVVLTWNRYGGFDETATHAERKGATVLVAENSPIGDLLPGTWYALARSNIALCGGSWAHRGPDRWASWGITLEPWRTSGDTVIMGQRGIGRNGIASPSGWAERMQARIGGRIRAHPGTGPARPLRDDLACAGAVVAWCSAAAVQALAMGVPVVYGHADFALRDACTSIDQWPLLRTDDAARLAAFERLAWGIASLDEISSGTALERLL